MIMLTGVTGFVGPHLVRALCARREPVRCLVRDLRRARRLGEWGAELVQGDLHDRESLEQALAGARHVIHMAKLAQGSTRTLAKTNREGTRAMVRLAERQGVERFIHLSALGAAPKPQFAYAYSEWQAEELLRHSRLNYLILRPTVIVGPGDPFSIGLIRLVRRWPVCPLPGSGRTRYQPLWVGDLVRCLLLALDGAGPDEQIVPLGGGQILTLEEMLLQIMAALQRSRPLLHLPRRPMRRAVRLLQGLGLSTPWVPGHFLGTANLAGPGSVERAFGFQPRGWSDCLPQLLACPAEQNLLA